MFLFSAMFLAACAPEEVLPPPDVLIVRTIQFGEVTDGVSPGFDLDGLVTEQGDNAGCDLADRTGPDGTPGVDNSFGDFLPLLYAAGAEAIPVLLQSAVDQGELLISVEIGAAAEDGCIPVAVGRAMTQPVIGGDGKILPNQTFDRNPDFPVVNDDCAVRTGDTLVINIDSIRIPLTILGAYLDLEVHDARISVVSDGAGGFTGALGGGLYVDELKTMVAGLGGIGDQIPALVDSVLATRADLRSEPGGACDRMSAVLTHEAVPAFFFE